MTPRPRHPRRSFADGVDGPPPWMAFAANDPDKAPTPPFPVKPLRSPLFPFVPVIPAEAFHGQGTCPGCRVGKSVRVAYKDRSWPGVRPIPHWCLRTRAEAWIRTVIGVVPLTARGFP